MRITIIMTIRDNVTLAQLRLLQLVSPALPVGGFAFSHGLEFAVDAGWVSDVDSLRDWIEGVLDNAVAAVDVPLLLRLHAAAIAGDAAAVAHWNAQVLAWRETAELLQADVAMGGALVKLLRALPTGDCVALLPAQEDISWVTAFALAGAGLQIDSAALAPAYLWNFIENQVTSALKLMPLGQTAGQQLLLALAERIPALVQRAAALDDAAIGIGTPAVALASSWHETQYSRLFRS